VLLLLVLLLPRHLASAAIWCSFINYFAQRVSQNSSSVNNCTMQASHLRTSLWHPHLSCRKEEDSFATAEAAAAGPAIDS
jgi:hypothetical protein